MKSGTAWIIVCNTEWNGSDDEDETQVQDHRRSRSSSRSRPNDVANQASGYYNEQQTDADRTALAVKQEPKVVIKVFDSSHKVVEVDDEKSQNARYFFSLNWVN